MKDLSEYFSKLDRIKELEKKVANLISEKSKWKLKYEKLQGNQPKKVVIPTRMAKAMPFVINWHNGDRSLTFRQIADKCFITHQNVKNISCKLRKDFNFK